MMKHAFIFPGQGSQKVGMLAELSACYPIVRQTFEEASDRLHYDVWTLTSEGPEDILNQTDKTQPVLLTSSVAIWRVWRQQGGPLPAMMAGHSFGEYSALVCAEVLTFSDAVSLAEKRGQVMQKAVPQGEGAMAAVLGLEDEKIVDICKQVANGQIVEAVNFNAPGQVVIAGHTQAVEKAMAQAKMGGAKKTVLLPVSVPAHCRLMLSAAEKMEEYLNQVTFRVPNIPVIHNVDVSVKTQPQEIRQALVTQLYRPVRWVETIQKMETEGITTILEGGPGKVLSGLNKRITRQMNILSIFDPETLNHALETL